MTPSSAEQKEATQLVLALANFGTGIGRSMVAAGIPEPLVSNTAVAVLCILGLEGGMRPTELAERVGMTRGGATKLIGRLERNELVVKHRDPSDQRALRVELTPRARAALRDVGAELIERLTDVAALRSEIEAFTDHGSQ